MRQQAAKAKLKPFVIEVFSGCQAFARSIRNRGLQCLAFDLNQGPSGDVLKPSVFRRLVALMKSGNCRGILFAPPCTTFSSARHPAVRSRRRPRGLHGLVGRDAAQVLEANAIIDRMIVLLRIATTLRIPWLVENPRASILWHDRGVRSVIQQAGANLQHIHMCAFGCRWRKPTTLCCFRLPTVQDKRCVAHNHICQYSGMAHIPLRGRDANGVVWTKRAQAYSKPLADHLAVAFHNAAIELEFESLCAEKGRIWGSPKRPLADSG